jgi:hypothetical protein
LPRRLFSSNKSMTLSTTLSPEGRSHPYFIHAMTN